MLHAFKTGFCTATAAIVFALTTATSAHAETIKVTDIAGRVVEVEKNPKKIVLGEGRMIYSLALLDREQPFARVTGWANDMINYDPDAYRKYLEVFPNIDEIPVLGNPWHSEWSLESVIAMDAEVVFMNLSNLLRAQESGIIDKLEDAGIATIFVDFRTEPTRNTIASLQLMGRILDRRDEADEFTDYYQKEMMKIFSRVNDIPAEDRPVVFVENVAGWTEDACCKTYGSVNFGRFVEMAGGRNWGTENGAGYQTPVSLEALFAADPEVIIGTGGNWYEANPSTIAAHFGYEAEKTNVQSQLTRLSHRDGWEELQAVKNGDFHSVYHQFYNSPYHFVAMQAFAKWLHPEVFADLDPEALFEDMHAKFLPIDHSGVFWGSVPQAAH